MKTDEVTKNHQINTNTAECRMYARDDDLCPRPNAQVASLKWYNNIPLGYNTIGNFMPELLEAAKLSRRNTNHSVRASSVHILDNIGNFAERRIMSVTGTKKEKMPPQVQQDVSQNCIQKVEKTVPSEDYVVPSQKGSLSVPVPAPPLRIYERFLSNLFCDSAYLNNVSEGFREY
ncbi:hypothetical protein KUTeg_000521 [Tegillarca granosa]|uniref:Uncharacterized protein n=1 Tax=Tegillarca granosa TaxID=220873 RepID=A0ABQ9G261_TEGGR|nr:hypothetical protein KUTeg_000521 [Tegillarca granosa]